MLVLFSSAGGHVSVWKLLSIIIPEVSEEAVLEEASCPLSPSLFLLSSISHVYFYLIFFPQKAESKHVAISLFSSTV